MGLMDILPYPHRCTDKLFLPLSNIKHWVYNAAVQKSELIFWRHNLLMAKKDFQNTVYKLALQMLGIFAIPAIAGLLLGYFIDDYFDSSPYGTLGVLAFFYVLSWSIVFRTIQKVRKMSLEENKDNIEQNN